VDEQVVRELAYLAWPLPQCAGILVQALHADQSHAPLDTTQHRGLLVAAEIVLGARAQDRQYLSQVCCPSL
jgi:hypothetical protein